MRFHRAADESSRRRRSLTTVVTRLAIDHLRSARVRRESYVGPWLPEPLVRGAPGPAEPSRRTRRSRSRSSYCWSGSRPSSARSTCCTSCSATGTARSPRWSARAAPTAARSGARARRHVERGRPRFEPSRREREALARALPRRRPRRRRRGAGRHAGGRRRHLRRRRRQGARDAAADLRRGEGGAAVGESSAPTRARLTLRPADVNGQPGSSVSGADGEARRRAHARRRDDLVQAVGGGEPGQARPGRSPCRRASRAPCSARCRSAVPLRQTRRRGARACRPGGSSCAARAGPSSSGARPPGAGTDGRSSYRADLADPLGLVHGAVHCQAVPFSSSSPTVFSHSRRPKSARGCRAP